MGRASVVTGDSTDHIEELAGSRVPGKAAGGLYAGVTHLGTELGVGEYAAERVGELLGLCGIDVQTAATQQTGQGTFRGGYDGTATRSRFDSR